MSKLTEGPWKVDHDGASLPLITTTTSGRFEVIAKVCDADGNSEQVAKLMAAAPELLAALKLAYLWVSTVQSLYPNHPRVGGTVFSDMRKIQDIVWRAEGKL